MTPSSATPKFVTLPEIRRAARERLPRDHWNFGDGAAETESSKRRNRRHLDRLAIQQNVLAPLLDMERGATIRLPFPARMLRNHPRLRRIPARLVGMGVRPEHVRTPNAFAGG